MGLTGMVFTIQTYQGLRQADYQYQKALIYESFTATRAFCRDRYGTDVIGPDINGYPGFIWDTFRDYGTGQLNYEFPFERLVLSRFLFACHGYMQIRRQGFRRFILLFSFFFFDLMQLVVVLCFQFF